MLVFLLHRTRMFAVLRVCYLFLSRFLLILSSRFSQPGRAAFLFLHGRFWLHHQNPYGVLPRGHLMKFGQPFNPCTDDLHHRATTITGKLRPRFYCGNNLFHIEFKQGLQ